MSDPIRVGSSVYQRRAHNGSEFAVLEGRSLDDKEFVWQIKVDPKSKQEFFVNVALRSKAWTLPDVGGTASTSAPAASSTPAASKGAAAAEATAAVSATSLDAYRERVRNLYLHYNPSKIGNVSLLLERYAGNEEALIADLVKRYGPEPAAGSGHDSGGDASSSRPLAKGVAAPPAAAVAAPSYRDRVQALYAAYSPAKLHTVDAALRKYEGQEDALISVLVQKFGPEPPLHAAAETAAPAAAAAAVPGPLSPATSMGDATPTPPGWTPPTATPLSPSMGSAAAEPVAAASVAPSPPPPAIVSFALFPNDGTGASSVPATGAGVDAAAASPRRGSPSHTSLAAEKQARLGAVLRRRDESVAAVELLREANEGLQRRLEAVQGQCRADVAAIERRAAEAARDAETRSHLWAAERERLLAGADVAKAAAETALHAERVRVAQARLAHADELAAAQARLSSVEAELRRLQQRSGEVIAALDARDAAVAALTAEIRALNAAAAGPPRVSHGVQTDPWAPPLPLGSFAMARGSIEDDVLAATGRLGATTGGLEEAALAATAGRSAAGRSVPVLVASFGGACSGANGSNSFVSVSAGAPVAPPQPTNEADDVIAAFDAAFASQLTQQAELAAWASRAAMLERRLEQLTAVQANNHISTTSPTREASSSNSNTFNANGESEGEKNAGLALAGDGGLSDSPGRPANAAAEGAAEGRATGGAAALASASELRRALQRSAERNRFLERHVASLELRLLAQPDSEPLPPPVELVELRKRTESLLEELQETRSAVSSQRAEIRDLRGLLAVRLATVK